MRKIHSENVSIRVIVKFYFFIIFTAACYVKFYSVIIKASTNAFFPPYLSVPLPPSFFYKGCIFLKNRIREWMLHFICFVFHMHCSIRNGTKWNYFMFNKCSRIRKICNSKLIRFVF